MKHQEASIPEVEPKKMTVGQQWMLLENMGQIQTCRFRRKRRIPAFMLLILVVLSCLGASVAMILK